MHSLILFCSLDESLHLHELLAPIIIVIVIKFVSQFAAAATLLQLQSCECHHLSFNVAPRCDLYHDGKYFVYICVVPCARTALSSGAPTEWLNGSVNNEAAAAAYLLRLPGHTPEPALLSPLECKSTGCSTTFKCGAPVSPI